MAEVAESRALALGVGGIGVGGISSQSRHEIRSLGHGAKQLALKARVREDLLEVLNRQALIAGRVDRVEADQALKERGGVRGKGSLAGRSPSTGHELCVRGVSACCKVSLSAHSSDRTTPGKRGQAASSSRV